MYGSVYLFVLYIFFLCLVCVFVWIDKFLFLDLGIGNCGVEVIIFFLKYKNYMFNYICIVYIYNDVYVNMYFYVCVLFLVKIKVECWKF